MTLSRTPRSPDPSRRPGSRRTARDPEPAARAELTLLAVAALLSALLTVVPDPRLGGPRTGQEAYRPRTSVSTTVQDSMYWIAAARVTPVFS